MWLDKCTKLHKCSMSIPTTVKQSKHSWAQTSDAGQVSLDQEMDIRPKRLIDLMAFGTLSSDVQLVDDYPPLSSYAALSYCWGTFDASTFNTTTKTLDARMKRINFLILSLTIRQAIEVTRSVGIRYIWVDALCILQDSKSDWEIESSKMGLVYGNATLTIAADFGESANDGCYAPFSQNHLNGNSSEVVITTTMSSGQESSLYFEHMPSISTPDHLWQSLEGTELASRAWVCQERLLSSRIVHFTKHNLIWECQELIDVDDGIFRDSLLMHPVPKLRKSAYFGMSMTDDVEKQILDIWYRHIISDSYSDRQLTVSFDKLPAIASLARFWSQYLPSSYLAGIWQTEIWFGLSWRCFSPHTSSKPNSYRCPSWSWAAVDNKVDFNYGRSIKSMIKLVDANIEHDGQDPFGRVVGGHITIRGLLHKLIVREHPGLPVILQNP
jgi:hypothetical protein